MDELNRDVFGGEIIECRFAIGLVLMKILPFVTICLLLAFLASSQIASTLAKMLLLAVLTTSAAAFMIKLSRKVPRAVLCRGTLSVWCYQCEEGGLSKREQERLRIPLHEIERVWVGRPKDYQGSWPSPG